MRDKVKRFISILMTALMLVNLMPVGALADGITSIGYKPEVAASTGNYTVYVYARFDGDPLPGVTLNGSQWYTIGYIKDVNLPSPGGISWGQYWYYNNNNYCGSTINSTSASGIIGGLVQEYNTSIVIKSDEWISANFKACPGADTYKPHTSEPTWHLDIIVDINKNPPVHNLVFKVNNSNGKQIGTPKKVTGRWTNPLSANKYYAGNPVPETIIDGGRIYQLKTKREGNPNLGTKIYFNEPIKNVEFYYKDMGPVKRNYTVNHYWMGEQNKPIQTETKEADLGSTVTKSPIKIDGYTPVSDASQSITITEGTNVINFYYYKNVELEANSKTVPYNGKEQSVSGFTGAPTEADFSDITVSAKGTNAGTYHANFPTGTKGMVDATGKYIVTKAINGSLTINKREVTLTSASDKKVYDGNALTNDKVTVSGDGFVEGEGATYKVTGTQTNVGKSKNTFTYELNGNTKAINYTITTAEGELEVTPVTDEVVVTITGHNSTVTYNGSEQSVNGYDVSIAPEGVSYTTADFSFNGNAEAKGTDAGEYKMGLTAKNFENTNTNFTNVTFVVTDGYVKINPRSVTLTSTDDEKVYDGTPLTNDKVTVGGDGFVEGEGATYNVTGSQTVVGESDNTFTYTLNKGTKADNYTIEKTEGKLKVTAATEEVVVTIKENAGTAKYDGTEKTVTGYTVTNISNKLYAEKDFTFNGTAEVKGTDAGTYDMALKASDFANTNANFSKVTFKIEDGQLVIEKRKVTLTSASDEKVYDGTALTNGTVTVGGADGFADGEGAEYNVTGTQTNVGSSDNKFTYTLKKGTKADNYDIKTENGTLTVTPVTDKVTVTITGNTASEKYDGTEKTASGYGVSISNEKYTEADFEFKGNAEVKGTDANTYPMGLTAANFTNKSANFTNVEFVVTDGSLTINKRSVTLTSASDSKVYDGTALTNGTVTVGGADGFADGEGAEYNVTGTQTNVGSSDNKFTYTLKKGTKADNYDIKTENGTLTVTPVTDKVTVTITGNTASEKYDGTEKTASGYGVSISNEKYTEADFEFKGNAEVKGTDANTYPMGLTAANFTNKSANFTNVEFVVTDGSLTINKRSVTLTSETAGKTYDGTPLTRPNVTVGGDGFVEGQVKEIKATGSVTNAGSVANTITFTPNKETFKEGNYAITKTEGTLTIAKRSVLITSQSATKTYDGSALTRPAVTITGDGFVPGEMAKAEATGSITKVGSTPNAIQYTTTGAFNAANYSIALSVGTLTVTEKPKPEPRRTFNLTINYVYQNGKRAAASYNRGGLKNGETFDITSPVIAGYTASETVVSGTIYNRDIKVTVIYTADGVNLDDYGVPLGLGNITMNVGDCFE